MQQVVQLRASECLSWGRPSFFVACQSGDCPTHTQLNRLFHDKH